MTDFFSWKCKRSKSDIFAILLWFLISLCWPFCDENTHAQWNLNNRPHTSYYCVYCVWKYSLRSGSNYSELLFESWIITYCSFEVSIPWSCTCNVLKVSMHLVFSKAPKSSAIKRSLIVCPCSPLRASERLRKSFGSTAFVMRFSPDLATLRQERKQQLLFW